MLFFVFFFFKQKTAYDMRISDWSSDVCSSDLPGCFQRQSTCEIPQPAFGRIIIRPAGTHDPRMDGGDIDDRTRPARGAQILHKPAAREGFARRGPAGRSEEHTSELQSLMRISDAVFCLKKTKIHIDHHNQHKTHSQQQSSTTNNIKEISFAIHNSSV